MKCTRCKKEIDYVAAVCDECYDVALQIKIQDHIEESGYVEEYKVTVDEWGTITKIIAITRDGEELDIEKELV